MTLRSITAIPCTCPSCGWKGVSGDCEGNGEGVLCCPSCLGLSLACKAVEIHYNEHERNPQPEASR